jgi:hypothetical protein
MAKFQPGQSGNPQGRPAGSLNKHTQLIRLLEPHAEAIVQKTVDLALLGDPNALRLCLERLIPKATERPTVTLPDLSTTPIEAWPTAIMQTLSDKKINPSNLTQLLALFEYAKQNQAATKMTEELQERMAELLQKYQREY